MIASLLEQLGPSWSWVVLGLVLMGAELAIPGVFLVWFGLAALVTGLEMAMIPMPWQGQLILFAILAVGFVVMAARRGKSGPNDLNRGAQALVGREFPLDSAIVGGLGRIRVNDTLWRVSGPDAPAETRIRVTGVEGTMLTVVAA